MHTKLWQYIEANGQIHTQAVLPPEPTRDGTVLRQRERSLLLVGTGPQLTSL